MEVVIAAFAGFLVGGIFGIVIMAIVACKVLNGNEGNEEL